MSRIFMHLRGGDFLSMRRKTSQLAKSQAAVLGILSGTLATKPPTPFASLIGGLEAALRGYEAADARCVRMVMVEHYQRLRALSGGFVSLEGCNWCHWPAAKLLLSASVSYRGSPTCCSPRVRGYNNIAIRQLSQNSNQNQSHLLGQSVSQLASHCSHSPPMAMCRITISISPAARGGLTRFDR